MGACTSAPTPAPAALVGRWRGALPDGTRSVELTVSRTGKVTFSETSRASRTSSTSTSKEFSGLPCTGWEPGPDGVAEIVATVACITVKRKIRVGAQDGAFEWCHDGKTWITMKRIGGAVPMQPVVLNEGGASGAPHHVASGPPPPRKYRRQEVFLDVIEALHYNVSQPENDAAPSSLTVTEHEVRGRVVLKALLNGTSECKLGLSDRLTMEASTARDGRSGVGRKFAQAELLDVELHDCVDKAKFEADRSIVFSPPDGEFELLRYRSPGALARAPDGHALVRQMPPHPFSRRLFPPFSERLAACNAARRGGNRRRSSAIVGDRRRSSAIVGDASMIFDERRSAIDATRRRLVHVRPCVRVQASRSETRPL